MPKRTPEKIVGYIVDCLIEDPSFSYPAIVGWVQAGFSYTISIQGVKNIALRECVKVDPKWEKINPLPKTYKCQFRLPNGRKHLKQFKGVRGYSGANAVNCPEHRGKKKK